MIPILLVPLVLLFFSQTMREALEIFLVVRKNFQYNLSPFEIASAKIEDMSLAYNSFDSDYHYGVEMDLNDCASAYEFFKKNPRKVTMDTLSAVMIPFFYDELRKDQGILLLHQENAVQYVIAFYDSNSCKLYFECVHL